MLDKIFPKIHAEGYKFLAISIIFTIFLYFISTFLGLVSFVLAAVRGPTAGVTVPNPCN